MYTQFYGLREKPFSLSPDPRYLYLAEPHREALAHLLYGIEQGEGFICVTGEVGTGKTTLCRTLLQRLDAGTEVAFIFNPQLSGAELVQAINAELGLPLEGLDRRELLEQLNRFLLTRHRDGRRVLLIIDEAQVMERDALEQVRLLSNLETNTAKLIQIVLIGQPELDEVLESPDLRQLRQRISVRWRLEPLSPGDARAYIRHRLRIAAGAPRELFTDLALREIHRRSKGIPRVINLLCDRALLAGYAAGATAIGLGLVTETDREVRASQRSTPLRTGISLGARLGGRIRLGTRIWLGTQIRRFSSSLSSLPTWIRDGALPVLGGVAVLGLALVGWLTLDPLSTAEAALPGVASAPPEVTERAPSPVVEQTPGPSTLAAVESRPPSLLEDPDLWEGLLSPDELEAEVDLGTTLAHSSPAETIASSLDALLESWAQPVAAAELLSLPQMLASLRERGFSVLSLQDARLATLYALNLPALLVLRALDGAPRYVALSGIRDGALLLEGVVPGTLSVAGEELETVWQGVAYVPWRDYESLPPVLRPGAHGPKVTWLQRSLMRLGVFRGVSHGRYDAATIAGVRALQERLELAVDGTVGPVTKIQLYRALPGYTVPALRAPRNEGSS